MISECPLCGSSIPTKANSCNCGFDIIDYWVGELIGLTFKRWKRNAKEFFEQFKEIFPEYEDLENCLESLSEKELLRIHFEILIFILFSVSWLLEINDITYNNKSLFNYYLNRLWSLLKDKKMLDKFNEIADVIGAEHTPKCFFPFVTDPSIMNMVLHNRYTEYSRAFNFDIDRMSKREPAFRFQNTVIKNIFGNKADDVIPGHCLFTFGILIDEIKASDDKFIIEIIKEIRDTVPKRERAK